MSEHVSSLSSTTSHGHTGHEHSHGDPAKEARKYALTLVALLILTAITVGVSYFDFGAGNVVVALLVATIKASLVALIFMHLAHDKPMNAVILVGSFVFLSLLLAFSLADIDTRENLSPASHKPPAGGPAVPQKAAAPQGGAEGSNGTAAPAPAPAEHH